MPMPATDQAVYDEVVRRMSRIILGLGIAVVLLLTAWKGILVGGGFLIGSAASYLSFWRWRHVGESVGPAPMHRSPWLLALRFMLILAVRYVIIKLTAVNLAAAPAGLLAPRPPAPIEILYQLIFQNPFLTHTHTSQP